MPTPDGKPRDSRLMPRWSPMVWAAVALLGSYWSIAAVVLAVDPYDIYPWGLHVQLPSMDTTESSRYLIAAAAKTPDIDLLMIGSSMSVAYTPEQIQAAFPGTHHAWNESYLSPRPVDRALTVETFLKYSHAKRLILWADWTYGLPVSNKRDAFPVQLYDASYVDDLDMVDQQAIVSVWNLLHGSTAFRNTRQLLEQRDADNAVRYAAFHGQYQGSFEQLIRDNRQRLMGPWHASCARFPALATQLLPELKELSQRRIAVDLVFPAYSAPAYYFFANYRGAGPLLTDQLELRRCVVATAAGIPGVAVWAPDADGRLIANIANYMDFVHLYDRNALLTVLGRVGDPAYRIDSTNVESYLGRLRADVLDYDAKNSGRNNGASR